MLHDLPILIVEDEPLIAMLLTDAVEALDGRVIGPFDTVAAALASMDRQSVAGAIMDANLADRDITPVAERMLREDVPFVLYTGTGLPGSLESHRGEIIVVMKPGHPAERLMAMVAGRA